MSGSTPSGADGAPGSRRARSARRAALSFCFVIRACSRWRFVIVGRDRCAIFCCVTPDRPGLPARESAALRHPGSAGRSCAAGRCPSCASSSIALSSARSALSEFLQHVVAFVALVRQQHVAGRRRERQRQRPRLDVGLRIVDVHFVPQFVGVDAVDPLGQLEVGAVAQAVAVAAADAGLVGEVRRLDDERVAFPVAARVAQVLPDLRAAGADGRRCR